MLVERRHPPHGWALPGGFVDYGETLSAAVIREAREETGLEVEPIELFHAYSDPSRDPRRHTISTVYICRASGTPRAGDDARQVRISTEQDLPPLVFDHSRILDDYFRYRRTGVRPRP